MSISEFSWGVLFGGFLFWLMELLPILMRLYDRKRAGHDCSKCKAWYCGGMDCYHIRKKKKP